MRRAIVAVLLLVVALIPFGPPAAAIDSAHCQEAADPLGRPITDCAPGSTVFNILPPGSDGRVTAADPAPKHQQDQLAMYSDLKKVAPNLAAADLDKFYKQARFDFDLNDMDPSRTVTFPAPHNGTLILRDKAFGVPHVFGLTREDTEYGAGYAAAEDRLFLMDVLRHVGKSRVTQFLGISQSTLALDCTNAMVAGYSEAELDAQVDPGIATLPFDANDTEGSRIAKDGSAYVDGINGYIAAAVADPVNKMPVEYATLTTTEPANKIPQPWHLRDIASVATIVQSIFATGGGDEVDSALLYQTLTSRYGPEQGSKIWHDFREQNDPQAPVTLNASFPYMTQHQDQVAPSQLAAQAGVALPDPGQRPSTIKCEPAPNTAAAARGASRADQFTQNLRNLLARHRSASNALLVGGASTASGHPIAVFGPQTGYFQPEILHEEDLHGPGIQARGVAFPGTDVYVELGHGVDYAWSATSASSDLVDERLELLCPDGTTDLLHSTKYAYGGDCSNPQNVRSMYERTDRFTVFPGAPSGPLGGEMTIQIERTIHGPVIGRTYAFDHAGRRVAVAIVYQRTTWFNELNAAPAFLYWNDPDKIHGSHDFFTAAGKETGTFNWFYADSKDIAYYSSGELPRRAEPVNGNFPSWGNDPGFEWQGFAPVDCVVAGSLQQCGYKADYLRNDGSQADPHPHAINPVQPDGQVWMTNWNNKPARDWSAADSNFGYGETYRVQSLSDRVQRIVEQRKAVPVDIVNAMEDGGSVDLDGTRLVPPLLDLMKDYPALTADQRAVLDALSGWNGAGAHRREMPSPNQSRYEHGNGVTIMDYAARTLDNADLHQVGLYMNLLHHVYDPWFKQTSNEPDVYAKFTQGTSMPGASGIHNFANPPGPLGSAYDASGGGWESNLQRSLRQARNPAIPAGYSQDYCGLGKLADCQAAVAAAIDDTIKQLREAYGPQSGPNDWTCSTNNVVPSQCNPKNDYISFSRVGAENVPDIPWINRPTFQQVIQFNAQRSAGSQGSPSPTPSPGQTGSPSPAPSPGNSSPTPGGGGSMPNAAQGSGSTAGGPSLADTGSLSWPLPAGAGLLLLGAVAVGSRRRGRRRLQRFQ